MITLISPRSPFLINDKEIPQLGIMYIYSYLKSKHMPVRFLDMTDNPVIPESDVYGITGTVAHIGEIKKIIKEIRSKYGADKLIILGGPFISSVDWFEMKKSGNLLYLQGEGEKALYQFLKTFHNHPNDRMSSFLNKNPFMISQNVDEYPFPCWDKLKGYNSTICHTDISIKGAAMITSRGCSKNCSFCSSPMLCNRKVRFHSVEYIIKHVKWLLELGYEGIYFLDDNITINKIRLFKLCRELMELKIPWRCFSRADYLDEEILLWMERAGCLQIEIGIESGSQKILDINSKGTNVVNNIKVIQMVKDAGIIPKLCYIVGLPGEDDTTIQETVKFMKTVDTFGSVNVFVPYPGSDIYNNPEKYNYKIDNGVPFDNFQVRDNFTVVEEGKKEKIEEWRNILLDAMGNNDIAHIVKDKANKK